MKPLGQKAYGHIGHLPMSRMGPGDHHVHAGQAVICTRKARDKRDCIIVQEKLDGSCVAAAKLEDGSIVALGRSGYLAQSSKYEQHQLWAHWVREHEAMFSELLDPGERVVGEWLAQAHGTRYDLSRAVSHSPFVAFDLMDGNRRERFEVFRARVGGAGFAFPLTAQPSGPISVEDAYAIFVEANYCKAIDPIEGVIYRVERDGEVDFLAKWVRPDKVDGCYLPKVTKAEPVWNWRP